MFKYIDPGYRAKPYCTHMEEFDAGNPEEDLENEEGLNKEEDEEETF